MLTSLRCITWLRRVMWLRRGLLALGLCCAGVVRPAALQQAVLPEDGRPERAQRSGPAHERQREWLLRHPPAERARLERHLAEFEKLPPAERAKLLERARALRARERLVDELATGDAPAANVGRRTPQELGATAEPSTTAELGAREELGTTEEPSTAQAHELRRERIRELGRELRARLPEDVRRRLERATPERRKLFLQRLYEQRERVSRRALARMSERRELPPHEVERLERLPVDERLDAMRELGGRMRRRGSG